jgi:hypothetical protein
MKEIEMSIGERKEILVDIFPTLTKQIKQEGKLEELKENILKTLKLKFGPLSSSFLKKIEKIDSEKTLDFIFEKAILAQKFEDLETELNTLFNKK